MYMPSGSFNFLHYLYNMAKEKASTGNPQVENTTDGLIAQLGGCGLFQILICTFCCMAKIASSWSLLFMVFGIYDPGMECDTDYSYEINEKFVDRNVSKITGFHSIFSRGPSKLNETSIDYDVRNTSLKMNNCETIQTCNGSTKFRGTASTVVTEWHLVCDRAWIPPVIISVQMAGILIGSAVSGHVATKYGRKTTLLTGLAFGAVFNFIATFSVSWIMFTAVRFIIGLTIGFILCTVAVLYSEFITNWWRGFVINIPDFYIGGALLSFVVWLLKDWKHIHYTTAACYVFIFCLILWTPESVRWFAINGKISKANNVVQRMSSVNKKPVPDTGIIEKLYALKIEHERESQQKYSYIALFYDGFLKSTVVIGFVKFTLTACQYSIVYGAKSLSGNFYLNFFFLQISAIPLRFLGSVTVNILGRRYNCISCLAGLIIVSICVVVIHFTLTEENRGLPTTVLAMISNSFLAATIATIDSWVIELYPTTVRNLAFSWGILVSRIGGIISPYLMPRDALPLFALFLIMGFLFFIALISVSTLPETKGKPLRDVINETEIKMCPNYSDDYMKCTVPVKEDETI